MNAYLDKVGQPFKLFLIMLRAQPTPFSTVGFWYCVISTNMEVLMY
jgi:hypothetical protein